MGRFYRIRFAAFVGLGALLLPALCGAQPIDAESAPAYPTTGYPSTGYPTTGAPPTTPSAPAFFAPPNYPTADVGAPTLLPAPPEGPLGPTELLAPPAATTPLPETTLAPTPASIYPTPPPPAPAAPQPTPAAAEVIEASVVEGESIVDATMADAALPPTTWYRPTTWFRDDPWDIGFELGINGSTGTSETMSIRTGGYVKRKTKLSKFDTSLYYNKNSADGTETQSNALFKGRHDWLSANSPWTIYAGNQIFYDEFQAFDLDVSVNTGIGYQIFDERWVKLLTSFGAGASREFGSPDEEWIPEAQFGFDWEQEVSKTQRFYAKIDYFPQWANFNRYRLLSDIGLEIDLACPSNVSLKVSATDRFDSDPDGVAPHNTNYSVLLLWKR